MDTKHLALVCLLVFIGATTARSAPFTNLNFEDAVLPGDLLPGWDSTGMLVNLNNVCLGSACVTLSETSIEGDYSVFLQGGTSTRTGDLPLVGAFISQTGDVPVSAKSITLLSLLPDSPFSPIISYENLQVSLGGSDVPLVPLEVTGNVIKLGGHIEAFAGDNTELVISTLTPELGGDELWAWLDDIQFSDQRVPEPSSLLLLLGVATVWALSKKMS